MRAKFAREAIDWRDPRFRKTNDLPLLGAMIAVTPKHPTGAVTAKFYMANGGNIVYCNLWVGYERRGTGKAGGWGYHKKSAALGDAITSAGIDLYGNPYGGEIPHESLESYRGVVHIDGRGEGSMLAALEAIVRAETGARKIRVITL